MTTNKIRQEKDESQNVKVNLKEESKEPDELKFLRQMLRPSQLHFKKTDSLSDAEIIYLNAREPQIKKLKENTAEIQRLDKYITELEEERLIRERNDPLQFHNAAVDKDPKHLRFTQNWKN